MLRWLSGLSGFAQLLVFYPDLLAWWKLYFRFDSMADILSLSSSSIPNNGGIVSPVIPPLFYNIRLLISPSASYIHLCRPELLLLELSHIMRCHAIFLIRLS